MTRPDGAQDRPCGWERTHLVEAAALALEGAGRIPASEAESGYRVVDTVQPEAVEVRAAGVTTVAGRRSDGGEGDELAACEQVLEEAGWQVSRHAGRGGRGSGRAYLLASPRRD